MKICIIEGCDSKVNCKNLCSKHYIRLKKNGTTDDVVGSHAPVEERLLRFIEKTETCWIWKGGSINKKGYGQIQLHGKGAKHILAHRLSYTMHKGEIPEGLIVMHKCDNPSCVNPGHLEVGTQSQNIKDAIARGRKISVPPHKFGESHGASKLTEKDVLDIRSSKESYKELSVKYNVQTSTIERAKTGRTWKHLK